MIKEKMFSTRVDSEVLEKFSKACKYLGFKQNSIIEGYMNQIINTAEQVEVFKNSGLVLGVVVPIFHEGQQVDLIVNTDDLK